MTPARWRRSSGHCWSATVGFWPIRAALSDKTVAASGSEHGAADGQDRRKDAGESLPVVAAVAAGEDLAVAGADVDALGVEAVRIEALAVDALVVVRARKSLREPLPAVAGVSGAVDGELART